MLSRIAKIARDPRSGPNSRRALIAAAVRQCCGGLGSAWDIRWDRLGYTLGSPWDPLGSIGINGGGEEG